VQVTVFQDVNVEIDGAPAALTATSKRTPVAAAVDVSAGARKRAATLGLNGVREAWRTVLGPGPVSPDALEQLLVVSNLRDVAAGQPVWSRRDVARGLFLLAQGDVGLGRSPAGGAFQSERSVHAPAWLDATSAWLGQMFDSDALALTNARIVSVSRSAFLALMERHAELAPRLIVALASQARALTEALHDLTHKDADARLAAWLLQRGEADPAAPPRLRVLMRERKRDVAAELGVSPETLSRLLRQLRGEGLIDVRGYLITVLDPPGLRARSGTLRGAGRTEQHELRRERCGEYLGLLATDAADTDRVGPLREQRR
jgi:CRP-like cAMP-binding protein